MNPLAVLLAMAREWAAPGAAPRTPEASGPMDNPADAAAYAEAGTRGVMAPTHLAHAALACDVIAPGDRVVVDLACGAGGVLVPLATLWPEVHFIGVDRSPAMLSLAAAAVPRHGLANVALVQADITALKALPDGIASAVVCTMALHHLPDGHRLALALAEAARLLAPGGGVYLADFVQLRSRANRRWLATRDAARQHPAFTRDYLASLDAAFPAALLRAAVRQAMGARVAVRTTRPLAMLAIAATRPRSHPDRLRQRRLLALHSALDPAQLRDLEDLGRLLPSGRHMAVLRGGGHGGGS